MLLPFFAAMSVAPFPPSSSTIPRISITYPNPHPSLHFPHLQFLKPLSLTSLSLHLRSLHPPSSSNSSVSGVNGELPEEDRDVIEVIAEIINEAGISDTDSLKIALNSPQYAKMLRESVKDLDELSLWSSWMNDGKEMEMTMSIKEKMKQIAKEKGDDGKIPYLESMGLSLSSAIHLARLLSSESLSSLVIKVKYLKELFFSGCDDERLVGKFARRMMLHLSISVDENVQQTLSFFEKIEARRGGLEMLGSCDASFRHLIQSFPRLLLLPVESNMKPRVKFLESVGVPRKYMGSVLLLFPPLLFLDIEEKIKAGSWPFETVGVMDKKLGRMLVKYPWLLSTSIQRNYKDISTSLETKMVRCSAQYFMQPSPHSFQILCTSRSPGQFIDVIAIV